MSSHLEAHNKHIQQRKWKENILAVCLACVFSFALYQGANNLDLLSADITGGPQVEFNELSDIVVEYVDDDTLQLLVGKDITEVKSVSVLVLFDPDEVRIEKDDITSDYSYTYSDAGVGQGSIIVSLRQGSSLSLGERLLKLSSQNVGQSLVFGDIVMHFTDGSTERLAVQLPR